MSTRYNASELDQRVSFQRRSITADGQGGGAETWTTIASAWAKVRPKSGRERAYADQVEDTGSYLIVVRYRTDIDAADRVVWHRKAGGVTTDIPFNIRFPADDGGRGGYLSLDCERGVVS